ncbi:MAG: hypothetical protein MJZ16_01455 [Bacteroidales bacterium]|nr:hypothetical protein [Bacteroidales bacterium]
MRNFPNAGAFSALIISLATVFSCVDEDYNLDKINDDMVIKWNSIAAPLGNLPAIKISDLIDVENNKYIKISDNGDYSIFFDGSHSETSFDTPSFKMGASDIDKEIESVVYSPLAISGTSPVVPVKFKSIIEISENTIPEEIISIESAKVKASLNPVFNFDGTGNISGIYLTKGTTLDFPSWVTIGEYNSELLSKSGSTLTLKKDLHMGANSVDLTCSATELDFSKLPEGQGLISKGEVYIYDSLVVKGGVYIREQDIVNKVTQDSFTATFSFNISDIEVLSATAVVKPSLNLDIPKVDTKGLSSLFNGKSNLDIYDMNINLSVGNETPLSATINADVNSFKDGSKAATVHIGPLEAKANATSSFFIGKRTGSMTSGLTDLISSLPDELSLTNIDIATSDSPVEYIAGNTYKISTDYSIEAPLAFGKNLSVELEYDLSVGLSLEEATIGSAEINFTAVNTIPLGMDVSAILIDEQGNEISGSSVNVNGSIGSGSLTHPNTGILTIFVTPGNNTDTIDSIRLFFRASCDENHEGESLNMNQSLSIQDVSLKVNDLTISL